VVAAKPLAAGLPLGATLFTERATQALPVNMHGTTFGGGPLACRVAIEFLALLDQLLPSVGETGDQLLAGLRRLQTRHPAITGIRGKGLMLGVQLSRPGHTLLLRALELSSHQAGDVMRILDEALTATCGSDWMQS
jgi:acetylornithine aminotransferase/acetylornithine/N-succinyldiaminopimelate aminotransferase